MHTNLPQCPICNKPVERITTFDIEGGISRRVIVMCHQKRVSFVIDELDLCDIVVSEEEMMQDAVNRAFRNGEK